MLAAKSKKSADGVCFCGASDGLVRLLFSALMAVHILRVLLW